MTHDTQGPPGGDTGGVKKTSPMKGKVFFTGDIQTDKQTESQVTWKHETENIIK